MDKQGICLVHMILIHLHHTTQPHSDKLYMCGNFGNYGHYPDEIYRYFLCASHIDSPCKQLALVAPLFALTAVTEAGFVDQQ